MAPKRKTTRGTTDNAFPTTSEELARVIAQAIAEHKANRANSSGGSGGAGRRGSENENGAEAENPVRGCSYKTFMTCKPCIFKGSEGAVGIVRWIEKMESVLDISGCSEDQKVRYATCTFQDEALSWWNLHVQSLGRDAAYALSWAELKTLMMEKYCPRSEVQKLEAEFWNLAMQGAEVTAYTTRFHELSRLVPHMVTPEYKRIERYIWGLSPKIRSMVTAAAPSTIQNVVTLAHSLTDDAVRIGTLLKKEVEKAEGSGNKRKWSNNKKGRNSDSRSGKKQETAQVFAATTTTEPRRNYNGPHPLCNKCKYHHVGSCESILCGKCKRIGHQTAH